MSWAWPRRTDVYLAPGLASAGTGGRAESVVRLPATFAPAEALRRLADAAPALFRRGTRVRIRLGPALCPLVQFEVPRDLRGWAELRALAIANAARALEMPAGDVVVAMDSRQPGCIAAMPLALSESLAAWSNAIGATLVSVAPDASDNAWHVEFVPSRAVPWVWACALAISLGAAVTALVQVARFEQDRSAALRLAAREGAARPGATHQAPRPASHEQQARAAARLLQSDPNRPLADVENMQETGAQLQSVSLDNVSGAVRLEYHLDSMPRAVSVTAVLNAGLPRAAWTLERWAAGTAQGAAGTPGTLKATWVSRSP